MGILLFLLLSSVHWELPVCQVAEGSRKESLVHTASLLVGQRGKHTRKLNPEVHEKAISAMGRLGQEWGQGGQTLGWVLRVGFTKEERGVYGRVKD